MIAIVIVVSSHAAKIIAAKCKRICIFIESSSKRSREKKEKKKRGRENFS